MHSHTHPTQLERRCGRRQAIATLATLAAAGTAMLNRSADAARGWCRSDPLIRIEDELVYVVFSAPVSIRRRVTGPTEIVVRVPTGVETEVISEGSGFGEGEIVRFEEMAGAVMFGSNIPIEIEATVPAREDLPIAMEFARRTRGRHTPERAEGWTNNWLRLSVEMSAARSERPKRKNR
jgi:hypothetical protein